MFHYLINVSIIFAETDSVTNTGTEFKFKTVFFKSKRPKIFLYYIVDKDPIPNILHNLR